MTFEFQLLSSCYIQGGLERLNAMTNLYCLLVAEQELKFILFLFQSPGYFSKTDFSKSIAINSIILIVLQMLVSH